MMENKFGYLFKEKKISGEHQMYLQMLKGLLPERGNQVFGINVKYNFKSSAQYKKGCYNNHLLS